MPNLIQADNKRFILFNFTIAGLQFIIHQQAEILITATVFMNIMNGFVLVTLSRL